MSDEKKIDDGGAAFPGSVAISATNDGCTLDASSRTFKCEGMSLRDYFAAAVLPLVWSFTAPPCAQVAAALAEECGGDVAKLEQLALTVMEGSFNQQTNRVIARECYQLADAMLAARKQHHTG
jgi:hypothetical protein